MDSESPTSVSSTENAGLRERILRASITLIEEEGLAALSLREVARRAGVSHQAPYHYFADREAILATLAERGFSTLRAAMEEAHRPGIGPTEAVEFAAIAYVQFACDYPAHFQIMFRPELVALNAHESLEVVAGEAFKHVPEMVIECMKLGFPASFGVDVMTTLLWSTVHGVASLLVDGQLASTLPDFAKDQKCAVAKIARALRLMVEATIAQERATVKPGEGKRTSKRRRH